MLFNYLTYYWHFPQPQRVARSNALSHTIFERYVTCQEYSNIVQMSTMWQAGHVTGHVTSWQTMWQHHDKSCDKQCDYIVTDQWQHSDRSCDTIVKGHVTTLWHVMWQHCDRSCDIMTDHVTTSWIVMWQQRARPH